MKAGGKSSRQAEKSCASACFAPGGFPQRLQAFERIAGGGLMKYPEFMVAPVQRGAGEADVVMEFACLKCGFGGRGNWRFTP
jgi:hypothetical protein